MNTLPIPSHHEVLHEQAIRASRKYHLAVGELLEALTLIERESVFLKYGCSSLFSYAVKFLELSEANAYAMIGVLRKSKQVPELKEKVVNGELDLYKAIRIVSVVTPTNQETWIEKAKTMTSRELEKEVAAENPKKEEVRERAQYVSRERLKLTLGLSEEAMKEFKRAQDLVSGSRRKGATLEETLEEMVRFYLKHKDPIEKAKRNETHKANQKPAPATLHVQSFRTNEVRNQRTPIPAQMKHEVNQRDRGKCQFKGLNGIKCESSRWTDLHHVKPVSEGGSNSPQNLITLCKTHHRSMHPMWKQT